jgi:hypothetical protein
VFPDLITVLLENRRFYFYPRVLEKTKTVIHNPAEHRQAAPGEHKPRRRSPSRNPRSMVEEITCRAANAAWAALPLIEEGDKD